MYSMEDDIFNSDPNKRDGYMVQPGSRGGQDSEKDNKPTTYNTFKPWAGTGKRLGESANLIQENGAANDTAVDIEAQRNQRPVNIASSSMPNQELTQNTFTVVYDLDSDSIIVRFKNIAYNKSAMNNLKEVLRSHGGATTIVFDFKENNNPNIFSFISDNIIDMVYNSYTKIVLRNYRSRIESRAFSKMLKNVK